MCSSKMKEHLIIDGHNAIHAVPDLAKEMKRDRNLARDSLLHLLEPLQIKEGCLLTVVFDGRNGPQTVSMHRGNPDYTIVYSSSIEGADGVIEKMLMSANRADRIVVVTNDGLIRNCAYANGASAMRVSEALKRLDHCIEVSKESFKHKGSLKNGVVNEKPFENKIPFPGK